jgi:hypothetical protein
MTKSDADVRAIAEGIVVTILEREQADVADFFVAVAMATAIVIRGTYETAKEREHAVETMAGTIRMAVQQTSEAKKRQISEPETRH